MTFVERMDIFKLRYLEKQTMSKTASVLGRKASSISRELKKGMDGGMYNPFLAEMEHLKAGKSQSPKLKIDGHVWSLIKPRLELRWSPEEIAKWLKERYPMRAVSGKTIYNYVYFHMKGELKKLALKDLRQRGKPRKKGNTAEKRGKIPDMTLIDTRPAEINARTVTGHWEGDLIIGKNHQSAICVTVERKTRFIQLDVLSGYDARTVRKTIEKRFKKLEPLLRKTLTLDQGHENSEHKTLSENLGIDVYFCHPRSPWEKGTCENTNYLIRDMLYPVTDFRELTQRDVSSIARKLNERPRKTLDFKTPKEVFSQLR
jgi:IS30 family transposase